MPLSCQATNVGSVQWERIGRKGKFLGVGRYEKEGDVIEICFGSCVFVAGMCIGNGYYFYQ
jgi:hypothetical protein